MSERGARPGTLGFIGLGTMGTPMSQHLIEAGYRVQGYDLSEAARAAFGAAGGVPVGSAPEAVAGAGAVILMLPDSNVVEQVVTTILDALVPGTIVIDMSSSEPERTRTLAGVLADHGVVLVDAPVSGGVKGAVAATLAIMVGGRDEDVAAARDILAALGTVYHAGQVGSGHAVKALNNLMSGVHLLASTEAVLTGERFGVKPEVMLEIVNNSTGRSWSTQTKLPTFVVPEKYDAGFALRLMLKDMRIAVDLAERLGMPIRLGADATALWAEAADRLSATADHTEIGRWLRELAAGQ